MAPTQPQRKKQKKQQEGSRLLPCPVCHRSFPHYFIHDHVNICLDTPQTIGVHRDRLSAAPVSPISRDCVSRACELENERATEEGVVVEPQSYAAGVRGDCGDAATEESKNLQRIPQSTGFSPLAEGFAERAKTFDSMPSMMWRENETCIGNPTEELGVDEQSCAVGVRGDCEHAATEESKNLQRIHQSTGFSPMAKSFAENAKTVECMPSMMWRENETCNGKPIGELGVDEQSCAVGVRGDCEHAATEESKILQRIHQSTGFSAMAEGLAEGVKTFESMPSMVCREDEIFSGNSPRGESTGELGVDGQASSTLRRLGDVSTKPGPGFKFVQVQRQSQARLSMLCKLPWSFALQRKPSVTVLQSGMVLLRSWLSLDIQQRLVSETQNAAHLFSRPTTAGGGNYHLYSMSFGHQWDAKTRRFAGDVGQELPAWMYDLSRDLASDAQKHTPVYAPGSMFAPDVALVNFYPVKSEELGVVGLGGHQDLDDFCEMPVVSSVPIKSDVDSVCSEIVSLSKQVSDCLLRVSVSVGDNMTFFYRRLPPLSRRKNGVLVVVDESAAKYCKDGDIAHNREKKITLESGDVLVFGGESRMVYHGTCNVQPGTRPPGLHMIPGRLNFTFRQCNTRAT